jgi:hypothetical protein
LLKYFTVSKVDQAIDGADVGRGIQLVHFAPKRGAPIGDDDGESNVDRQG